MQPCRSPPMLQMGNSHRLNTRQWFHDDHELAGLPFRTALAEDPVPPPVAELILDLRLSP